MEFKRTVLNNLESDRVNILILFFIALVVRLIALEQIFLISRDGIRFIKLARYYFSGYFIQGLSNSYHPLYPMIMSLVGGITGDFELAGKLISLILSSLTVIFVYLIGKSIYDSKTGLIGGIFFIVQPLGVRCSVDVLSDSMFLFLFVSAFYLGIKGGTEEKKYLWWNLGAGLCSGLAYLARPEGIFVAFFLMGWYFLQWIFHNKKITRFLAASSVLFFAFALFATPYILFIKIHTGTWQISMKASVVSMVRSLEEAKEEKSEDLDVQVSPPEQSRESADAQVLAPIKPREPFEGGSVWRSITHTPLKFIETYHFLLFLFLICGVGAGLKHGDQSLQGMLLLFLIAYLVGLCYLYYTVSYVSRRHFFPPIVISLPVAGTGFLVVQKQIAAWMSRANCSLSRFIAPYAALVFLLFTLCVLTPFALKPQGEDKLPLKQAAFWIKENKKKFSPIIMSNEPLVGYYAGGKNCLIPALHYPEFVRYITDQKIDYLVFSERDMNNGKKFLPLLQPKIFQRIPFGDKRVLIYEVLR